MTTYPAAGISAPVNFRAAWVLSMAEALGGAVTMQVVSGGKPVSISVGMFPFDLRTLTIVGGMPECAWMYWARGQIDRFYNPRAGYSMMLGTQANQAQGVWLSPTGANRRGAEDFYGSLGEAGRGSEGSVFKDAGE